MSERVSLPEAARELGCSPQAVREHMRRGIWDIGEVVRGKKAGKKRDAFYVFRPKLDKLLGKNEVKDETQQQFR